MIKIVADSGCDTFEQEGIPFEVVPLTIYTDEFSYVDDASLDLNEMLLSMENYKGRSYTACPGIDAWLKAFGDADEIIVYTLTSGLSGTYNSAMAAADHYQQEHPDAKIRVFDSLSVGGEMHVALRALFDWYREGKSYDEMCSLFEEYIKRSRLFFSFKSVRNLAQNGRVNKAVAAAIGVLNIRIVGTASKEGKVESVEKPRGDKKALQNLLRIAKEVGYEGGRLSIGHIENPELAQKMGEVFLEEFPNADIAYFKTRGLTGYYCERGGIMIGIETNKIQFEE